MTKDTNAFMSEEEKVFYTRIGEFIRHIRLAHSLSAKKVGNAVPVGLVSIQKYEAAKVRIPLWTLKRICDCLNISLTTILRYALNPTATLPETPAK